MFSAFFNIAKNTFRENLREPIFLLVLLSALSLIGIMPVFTLFVFREQTKLVMDTALATMLFLGWVMAVLCATHAVSEEIESGTANLLLAKPVNRTVFIFGKSAGILAALGVFCFLTGIATLMAMRIATDQFYFDQRGLAIYFLALAASCGVGGVRNYLRKSALPMAAILAMLLLLPLGAVILRFIPVEDKIMPYPWDVLPALMLIVYAVGAMAVLATALSTRLALIPNLLICAVVFTVGLMSDYLLGRFAEDHLIIAFFYAVIPNWQLFWMADALAAGRIIPLSYVLWAGLYFLFFISFFLLLAVVLFQHREVGSRDMA